MVNAGTPAKRSPVALNPEVVFTKTVQPFIASNCLACHNSKQKVANLDLQQFTTIDSVRANLKIWKKVAWRLKVGEMPPKSIPRPKPAAQQAVVKWVNAELARNEAGK
jgi:hypothetical protein